MQRKPFISIVIPVYNGADYLREAVDSALRQTYEYTEVIVVNDGSNDNGETERAALSYGNRIRYFAKRNGGVSSALNLALTHMRGTYFSWLSHDDYYLPHKLCSQVRFMESYELWDCTLYSSYTVIDESSGSREERLLPAIPPENIFIYLYTLRAVHFCSLLIPKDLLLSVGGFPEGNLLSQDYEVMLKLARMKPFVHVPGEPSLVVRRHQKQGSETNPTFAAAKRTLSHDFRMEALAEGLRHLPYLEKNFSESALLREFMLAAMRRDELGTGIDVIKTAFARLPGWSRKWEFMAMFLNGLLYYWERRSLRCVHPLLHALKAQRPSLESLYKSGYRINFKEIYQRREYGNKENVSGSGATLFQTRLLRKNLPNLLRDKCITSILDAGCGDCTWIYNTDMEGIQYIGADKNKSILDYSSRMFRKDEFHSFVLVDITRDTLPQAKAVMCRDFFNVLSFDDTRKALDNFKKTGATWLLATTFPFLNKNIDSEEGKFRPLNLMREPFSFPPPIETIDEKNTDSDADVGTKHLGLWLMADI